MNSLMFDRALPVIRDIAGRKSSAFVRRCGLDVDERQDIESQLILTFLSRWPKFNSEKASVRTFASLVMETELTSILRYRLAAGLRLRELPPAAPAPSPVPLLQFRMDVRRAVASLPKVVQATASLLFFFSTVEAAALLGCSRQVIGRRKQRIRQAFLSAGIGPDYFAAGGRP